MWAMHAGGADVCTTGLNCPDVFVFVLFLYTHSFMRFLRLLSPSDVSWLPAEARWDIHAFCLLYRAITGARGEHDFMYVYDVAR